MGCGGSANVQIDGNYHDFHGKYALGPKLGEGSFGQVRAVTRKASQNTLVVKILDIRAATGVVGKSGYGELDPAKESLALKECQIWRRIGPSKYVIELFEVFVGGGMVYAVMERCECSLLDKLKDIGAWTEAEMKAMYRQMLLGLDHVHRQDIVHRDVKPDNFLHGLDGVAKLADFGLAASLAGAGGMAVGLQGHVGTAPYMSPEMISGKRYRYKTDMWSYGVTLYLMLFGNFPYGAKARSADEMKAAILEGKAPTYCSSVRQKEDEETSFVLGAIDFLKIFLARSPKQRCNASGGLALDFVQPPPPNPKWTSEDERVSWTSEETHVSGDFEKVVKMARARSHDFKSAASIRETLTFESDLDALLLKCQREHGASGADVRRSFSLPTHIHSPSHGMLPRVTEDDEETHMSPQPSCKSTASCLNRSSTHGGESSSTLKPLGTHGGAMAAANGADDADACSTPSAADEDLMERSTGTWSDAAWSNDAEDDDDELHGPPRPPPRLPRCQPAAGATTGFSGGGGGG
mmetsp:Transcript_146289/g.380232  ORF Transcript_146289/g.380232 Transcript_146289/m.380232 type:complete len:522 (+) Transcript_146289:3-1568(+)